MARKPRKGGGAKRPTKRTPFDDTQKVPPGSVLGDDCPVRALGHDGKGTYYFSTPVGSVRDMRENQMTTNGLISLFLGDTDWLERECAPHGGKRDRPGRWQAETAVQRLIQACRREGFFNPETQTRGPGLWPYDAELNAGEMFGLGRMLVLHAGDRVGHVTFDDAGYEIGWCEAGEKIGEFVYPATAPQPLPGDEDPTDEDFEELFAMLGRWKFRDGEGAIWLLFGWICCAYMPAALPFRPPGYIQGGSGVGKSTLLNFLEIVLMHVALKYDNATAAGLRDDFKQRNAALPVIINEAEVSEDNRRLQGLIEMARYTYTAGEGTYRRGGSGGAAHVVTAMFMFAAIEPPPLLPQDANRIAMLRLGKLEATPEQVEAFEEDMPELAREMAPKLYRRCIQILPMFGDTLNAFRKGLIEVGKHSQRTANTFGVLLSAAWLVRYGAAPDDSDIAEWATKLDAKLLANRDDYQSSEVLCLMHLLTTRVDHWQKGDQHPLGDHIERALNAPARGLGSMDADNDRAIIKRHGIAVVTFPDENNQPALWVAVANRHEGLEQIYKGTRWARGSWVAALRLLEGAKASPHPVRFAGAKDRATLIPARYVPKALLTASEVEDLSDEGRKAQGAVDD